MLLLKSVKTYKNKEVTKLPPLRTCQVEKDIQNGEVHLGFRPTSTKATTNKIQTSLDFKFRPHFIYCILKGYNRIRMENFCSGLTLSKCLSFCRQQVILNVVQTNRLSKDINKTNIKLYQFSISLPVLNHCDYKFKSKNEKSVIISILLRKKTRRNGVTT